jgi:hypothetical protein
MPDLRAETSWFESNRDRQKMGRYPFIYHLLPFLVVLVEDIRQGEMWDIGNTILGNLGMHRELLIFKG